MSDATCLECGDTPPHHHPGCEPTSPRPPSLDLDAIEDRARAWAPGSPFAAVTAKEVLALVAQVKRLSVALLDVGIKHHAEVHELRAQVLESARLAARLLKDSLPPEEKR